MSVPILDPVGAGGGMKLLWKNPNPATTFNAQTVPVDLTYYDAVIITSASYTAVATADGNVSDMVLIEKNKKGLLTPSYGYFSKRNVTVEGNGVTFGEGARFASYDGGNQTDNRYAIPVCIYGIKL